MADQHGIFRVVTREKPYSWGFTYRLRLEGAALREEQRLGRDVLGAPVMQRRRFEQPAGWEVDVTLIGRELQPGDTVDVAEILSAARLWSSWS